MKDETFYALALSLTPGIGKTRLHRLIGEVGASETFKLSAGQMRRLGLSPEARASLLSGRSEKLAEEELQRAAEKDIRLFSLEDSNYPQLLRQIHDPPAVLYAVGDLEVVKKPAVALVGSRRCSVYGREVSLKLSRDLATVGLTVVSGLARGVDCKAHQGALEVGGATAAVMGCGVDVVYPRENKRVYRRVLESGCILSEFPCGSFPAPQNFPIRNRIISGLCYGTIIAEAAEFSGSLITARLALEQDRELWAVPGNITSKGSYGPNYLIKQGAGVVLTAQDVIDDLPLAVLDRLARSPPQAAPDGASERSPPTPHESQLLKLLPADSALHFDHLADVCGLGLTELNCALLDLEMKGLIRQLPGRRFSKRLL